MNTLNYFAGVENQVQAKVRFRDLAMEHHPDRATQIMQAINAEYDRVKHMSDAELKQCATLHGAVQDLPERKREESAAVSRGRAAPPSSNKQPARAGRKSNGGGGGFAGIRLSRVAVVKDIHTETPAGFDREADLQKWTEAKCEERGWDPIYHNWSDFLGQ